MPIMDSIKKMFGMGKGGSPKYENSDLDPFTNPMTPPKNLMESVRKSYEDMRRHREMARATIKQFAGAGYSADQPMQPVPDNKIHQMVKIYMRLMASGTPQALVTAKYKELDPFAKTFAMTLNRHLIECDLELAFREATMSSFFYIGVIKTGIAQGDKVYEIDGELHDPGTVFSQSININNFVIDVTAESLSEIDYIGDRFKRDVKWIEEIRKQYSGISGESPITGGEMRDHSRMPPEERTSGVKEETDREIYKEKWVWEIYLPKQNLCCLYVDGEAKPIATYPFDGPEGGYYDIIAYDTPPGEVMPVSPASILLPMHNLINNIVRKLARQAERQKSLMLFRKGSDNDAETVKGAADGEVIGVMDPTAFNEFSIGGPMPGNHNFALWAEDNFDSHAGGLSVLAGTEAMTETASQDQLLSSSANRIIDEMRKAIKRCMKSVIKKHAWYIWTDPFRTDRVYKSIGSGVHVVTDWTPEVREGDFLDYNFDINPYSLTERTPDQKAAALMNIWINVVMPNAQLAMQSGWVPNVKDFITQVCEMQDLPSDIMLTPATEEQQEVAMSGAQQGMVNQPAQFRQSIQTRISRPGTTRAGNRNKIMSANASLMANNDQ